MAEVDDMQNQVLKQLERKQIAQEDRISSLELKHTELMAQLSLLIKIGRYVALAVGAGFGMDLAPYMLEG